MLFILSLCGATLPDRLLGHHDGNPKGHWEPLDARDINNAFLFVTTPRGTTTFRLQGEVLLSDDDRETYVRDIVSFLEGLPSGQIFVIKDPRIPALSDFWFEASHRAEISRSRSWSRSGIRMRSPPRWQRATVHRGNCPVCSGSNSTFWPNANHAAFPAFSSTTLMS